MRARRSGLLGKGSLIQLVVGAATLVCVCIRPVDAAPVEGADLLRRVQTLYGQSRRAIRSVEYDYTFDMDGNLRKARFARDGDRYYQSGVWVLPGGGFSLAMECAWDGQRVYDRGSLGQLKRGTDRSRFKFSSHVPESTLNVLVTWALGFEDELHPNFRRKPKQKFRFLGGRMVEDEEHGSCVELKFKLEWKPATLVTRHARRYAYAPVYWGARSANNEPQTEMSEVAYATIQSDGNELYYPVRLTTRSYMGGGKVRNTSRYRVDETTLKVNQPIPRSQFVLEPWPNEDVYDIEANKRTKAKDPRWSPVGKVSFPWDGFVEVAERNKSRRGLQQASALGTEIGSPVAEVPWTETWGGWIIASGAALALIAMYFSYRKRHPRLTRGLPR